MFKGNCLHKQLLKLKSPNLLVMEWNAYVGTPVAFELSDVSTNRS